MPGAGKSASTARCVSRPHLHSLISPTPSLPLRSLTTDPSNGIKPHLWDCYPGAWQQSWTIHASGLIELTGTNLCLDVVDGVSDPGLQLWQCDADNSNQEWRL